MAEVIDLYIEVFSKPPWNEKWEKQWVEDRIQWITSMPNSQSIVGEKENKIIGAAFGFGKPYKGKLEFEIIELFVSTESQNQGNGKNLIQALEKKLKKYGYSKTTILTARESGPEKFYKRLNFSRLERLVFMQHWI